MRNMEPVPPSWQHVGARELKCSCGVASSGKWIAERGRAASGPFCAAARSTTNSKAALTCKSKICLAYSIEFVHLPQEVNPDGSYPEMNQTKIKCYKINISSIINIIIVWPMSYPAEKIDYTSATIPQKLPQKKKQSQKTSN
jgi:hypothetical protein